MARNTILIIGLALVLALIPAVTTVADSGPTTAPANRLAGLHSARELPNPFIFNDGSEVRSVSDWPRRRAEIADAVQKYEYGYLPPPSAVKVESITRHPATQPAIASATEEEITLAMGPAGQIKVRLILTIPPTTVEHKPPFPVIVRGDLCWWRVKPDIAEAIDRRGYILAEFDRTNVAADKKGRGNGVYLAYPNFDGGALVAWAWGFSRVTDYLVTRPDVDATHIVFTGLSRGGKAALLAGALDERAALTVPASSGAGGAGSYRVQPPKSEDIAALCKRFPYWFQPHFDDFIGHVDLLPIDQHDLKILVAPRALLETSGMADQWANNEGSQATHQAAAEVYKFLGVPQKIGVHWRPGKHEQNLIDWTALLDFADWQFFGKTPKDKFDAVPFPEQPKAYTWSAP
jgi:hypothetical protein